jgi:hypothetical protein
MNIKELKKRLKKDKIPKKRYWLNLKLPGEVYSAGDTLCLGRNEENWEVYYTERGSRFDVHVFDNEQKACEYFYDRIIE